MNLDWETVTAHALALPGTGVESHYGAPAVKVNGRAFVTTGREADSFCLTLDLDMIEMLKETGPDTFWLTPRYDGWTAVPVRDASPDPERVLSMIEPSHAWNAARSKPKGRKKT